ncbi:hypothetical protein EZV73_04090 [Acidaminobacter sp. JC074]|uniref:hypothetical protein n=1 Tax=Acidaminobacter sp. JC074 TaxID=2530199 RepID=UPI001F0EA60A|nr:hypothetical protein [Acidaminobacter sp. JC074]MCH4886732.1 hypothetical protein [Acidaminobacter sp. JC074]
MLFTLINVNMNHSNADSKLSELIYTLESKNIETNVVSLKNITSKEKCHEINEILTRSELVIYMTVLDSKDSLNRLETFLDHYEYDLHPPMFLIIDSKTLLSVDTVEQHLDRFETFADNHSSRVINAKYFKDALEEFKMMKEA